MENSSAFVIALGMATTFIGLICLIILAKIMSLLCRIADRKEKSSKPQTQVASASSVSSVAVNNRSNQIPNRGEFVAAVAAAIAEDMGTDVSSIRILSIKKI